MQLYLKQYPGNILKNNKKIILLEKAFDGFSHSDIKTTISNSVKTAIIKGRKEITVCDILKEIYFYKYHGVENEEEYIRFLLKYGATHKEIDECLDISMRKVQDISKKMEGRRIKYGK